MDAQPDFPTPIGVFRAVDVPRYEDAMAEKIRRVTDKKGKGDLGSLLRTGDTWQVD